MKTRAHRIGQVGCIYFIASVIYFIGFFVFISRDSAYYSKENLSLLIQGYGLVTLITGMLLCWVTRTPKLQKKRVTREMILDERLEDEQPKRRLISKNIQSVLHLINMSITSCLIVGKSLGIDDLGLTTIAFAYSITWTLLGLVFIPMAYKGEHA